MQVELIYAADCPNVMAARQRLLKAFAETRIVSQWTEWDRADPHAPAYVKYYGSPTVLVNGKDVAGEDSIADISCCRLYQADGRYEGVPALQMIISAFKNSDHSGNNVLDSKAGGRKVGFAGLMGLLPGIGLAALPKVFCPACWPAYSALLGALGLGFVNYTPYLLPLTVSFLIVVMVMLGFRADQRHGYKPLTLGLVAAVLVLVGKFHFESDGVMTVGVVLLIAASVWNAWPSKRRSRICPSCP